jgi:predicted enzyme related to lactoylglutathione lyase
MSATGTFVWHELMVPTPSAAPPFYTGVTGWGTQKFDGPMDYTMWTVGAAPVGGLMALPPELASNGVPPHWLHYIAVNDVDATAKKAESLGGRINVPPTDIPDVGRFAVIADPQGAVFAIYKSAQDAPPAGKPAPGEFSWHELATTNDNAAFDFYSKLFGWKETSSMDMGGGMMYKMFGTPGREDPLGGIYTIAKEMGDMPPNWLGYVFVENVDDATAAVKKAGGTVIRDPMEIPGGRIAIFTDPQGAAFAVHEANG